ncbi:molybdenum cofactor guanylyltransferase [Naasia lichenicola]|uniref:Molybdopterin-guanine dinucleotide biosynthesis protein n=1 Tax=Naasia lichenicola TaxID=2565933 RepID=A0A4S4FIN4_9MICO|nr:NTP transferase domain-containing protein [Naasia lichenicola]THG29961.1 molybdopterin-guanine dinucleotide biosynthesis protein [Naasia lichenicola]
MIFDAVVLAGGRASRLGGLAKPLLLGYGGERLLDIATSAASAAARIVVVGDVPPEAGILVTREDPPLSGPVSALAAGWAALADGPSPFTLVLASDLPLIGPAVDALLAAVDPACIAADGDAKDGLIAIDDGGRDQYLLGLYSTQALAARLRQAPRMGGSMHALVDGLRLQRVSVPVGSTADVDTWADAELLGVERMDRGQLDRGRRDDSPGFTRREDRA